jgi:hypothetical protein
MFKILSTYICWKIYKMQHLEGSGKPVLYIGRKVLNAELSREYYTSDAIYNDSAGMTLYCWMCRSWQDCCRRGGNRSWPSVSVESVDIEYSCLNNAIFYVFIMRLTVEERVFILESYLKTMSYAHCRQSFFEKFRRQAVVKVL